MDPAAAQRIRESPDGPALAGYLHGLIQSLDSVSGIKLDDPVEIAVEVKGRMRAKQKLEEALSTLLTREAHGTLRDDRDSFDVG